MNTIEAISKYIHVKELKEKFIDAVDPDAEIDSLFELLHGQYPIWFEGDNIGIENDMLFKDDQGAPFFHIKEWKTIEEWMEENGSMKVLNYVDNLINTLYRFNELNDRDYKNVKAYDFSSAIHIIEAMLQVYGYVFDDNDDDDGIPFNTPTWLEFTKNMEDFPMNLMYKPCIICAYGILINCKIN